MKKLSPYIGLSVPHNQPSAKTLPWAKAKLARLSEQGYRRAIIERDAPSLSKPFFDDLATAAQRLGFVVLREPLSGTKRREAQGKQYDESWLASQLSHTSGSSWFKVPDHEASLLEPRTRRIMRRDSHRSVELSTLLFQEPMTVLVSAGGHMAQVQRYIAPERGLPFKATYHPLSGLRAIRRDAKAYWEEYLRVKPR